VASHWSVAKSLEAQTVVTARRSRWSSVTDTLLLIGVF
jgi:hypothetical protein